MQMQTGTGNIATNSPLSTETPFLVYKAVSIFPWVIPILEGVGRQKEGGGRCHVYLTGILIGVWVGGWVGGKES